MAEIDLQSKCLIWEKIPDICRDFPKTAENIKHFDKCTFKFDENGKRSGYCCRCGQCCVNMRWGKVKDKICRHLIQGVKNGNNMGSSNN